MSDEEQTLPESFGKYRVVSKLGDGGMGAVYLVEDDSGARFALKALKVEVAKDVDSLHRFMREMRMSLKVKHPHIVETYDTGHASDGTLYMVSEFCAGGDAAKWLHERGVLPADVALRWMMGLTSALDYAWREHGMIHRDIKPENLLIDAEDEIKLADLGLAKGTDSDATQLTAEGVAMGTVDYISPEQAQAVPDLDFRTDLYSLGATFYHLLAGKPMFTGETVIHVIRQHIEAAPKSLSDLRPDLSPLFARVIHSLVEKDPSDRPKSPGAALKALESVAADMGLSLRGETATGSAQSSRDPEPLGVEVKETMLMSAAEVVTRPEDFLEAVGRTLPDNEPPLELRLAAPAGPAWPGDKAILEIKEGDRGPEWSVAVYASSSVRFGRSRGGGVDMPFRIYPVAENKDLCMKISGVHGEFTATNSGWSITDLDSRNGVTLNGAEMAKSVPSDIVNEATVRVSSALELECYALARSLPQNVSLDAKSFAPAQSPALVVLRPDNRRDLAYALLRDRLPIGGPDPACALVPPGMGVEEAGALWWFGEHFWWQPGALVRDVRPDELVPLAPMHRWTSGALRFRLRPFSYDLFK